MYCPAGSGVLHKAGRGSKAPFGRAPAGSTFRTKSFRRVGLYCRAARDGDSHRTPSRPAPATEPPKRLRPKGSPFLTQKSESGVLPRILQIVNVVWFPITGEKITFFCNLLLTRERTGTHYLRNPRRIPQKAKSGLFHDKFNCIRVFLVRPLLPKNVPESSITNRIHFNKT